MLVERPCPKGDEKAEVVDTWKHLIVKPVLLISPPQITHCRLGHWCMH